MNEHDVPNDEEGDEELVLGGDEELVLGGDEETNLVGVVETVTAVSSTPILQPKDAERRGMLVAFVIVYGLGMLTAIAVYAIAFLQNPGDPNNAMHLNGVLTLVVGSVGPLAGFYFGQSRSGK